MVEQKDVFKNDPIIIKTVFPATAVSLYLGANSSMVKPAFRPVRQYSRPLAMV